MTAKATSVIVGDTNHQFSKQRLSPKKETCHHEQKACLVCGKSVGGEPTTLQTRIGKETERFSRMVIGSWAVDLLSTLPAKQKAQTKGTVLGILNKLKYGHFGHYCGAV